MQFTNLLPLASHSAMVILLRHQDRFYSHPRRKNDAAPMPQALVGIGPSQQ